MKQKFIFSLPLIALLTGCGGARECDDSDVLDQIKENTLQMLQSQEPAGWKQMMGAFDGVAEAGLAKAKVEATDVKITDVFNFRKQENGTRTCKAKLTMQSLNGERSVVMNYNVINYEDGYQVETDNSHRNLVARVVEDYIKQAQTEASAIRQAKMEERAASLSDFLSKAPQGNVCADHFDQASFVRDYVNQDLGDWVYEYNESLSEKVKSIVAQSKIGVTDIQTSSNIQPSNPESLDTSKYHYRCTGFLRLTFPDGTVDDNEEFGKIHFYAYWDAQDNKITYSPESEGEKFDLRGPARAIARKLKYGY